MGGDSLKGQRSSSSRNDDSAGMLDGIGAYFSRLYREMLYPDELNDPIILSGMRQMWADALPADKDRRHEEGMYWGVEKDGSYGIRRWESSRSKLSVAPPDLAADRMYKGLSVKGEMHVHPNPRPIDEFGVNWRSMPSTPDLANIGARNYSSNSYIIDNKTVIRVNNRGSWFIIGSHEEILGGK